MCLPDFYAFLCDVLGVISLTILVKILGFFAVNISICDKTTDLNYWIKHPFEFSDPILKPE